MFFMAMPGSFLSALLANINNRKSLASQPGSTVNSANSHVVGQGTSIQFTRNVVVHHSFVAVENSSSLLELQMQIDPTSTVKSEAEDPNNSVRLF
jgi:hypothetical protein